MRAWRVHLALGDHRVVRVVRGLRVERVERRLVELELEGGLWLRFHLRLRLHLPLRPHVRIELVRLVLDRDQRLLREEQRADDQRAVEDRELLALERGGELMGELRELLHGSPRAAEPAKGGVGSSFGCA